MTIIFGHCQKSKIDYGGELVKTIEIDTKVLQTDIEAMKTQLNAIKKDMNKMYEAVQTLDRMWNGPSNDAFNQQFLIDKSDMDDLCTTIQNIIKCMEFARKEYNNCDNQVNSIVLGIGV